LIAVTFEPGSKLSRIERSAFYDCSLLSSLCPPSSVNENRSEWWEPGRSSAETWPRWWEIEPNKVFTCHRPSRMRSQSD
jgi:hypothetical protein